MNSAKRTHSVMCEFKDPKELIHAAEKVRDAGFKQFEVYSPFPVHGMDAAMGIRPSKLPWIVLCGGATGLSCGFALQTWVSTSAYKLTISGKPLFSFQAFVPVTFECMVLLSAFSTVFGMFILNKLPQWYHATFRHSTFHKASSHGFFLSIEAKDPLFSEEKAIEFLRNLGGTQIEVVEA